MKSDSDLKASLEAFVRTHKIRGRCAVCQLAVRDLLDEQARAGVHPRVLWRWLINEAGHPEISESQISHHFSKQRHHEKQS